ncbi:hypothetical protein Aple_000710 [Acrocarpospora pleiomorpha]|uniref:Cupin n=1 Tax=Acrocarpospora pleiomorpha TaxID=90975 RepID=A0A5M3X937_9ACTN|nr:hypothetical protein [Acrocarpospora pleiomorpha]GES17176.1 hypothetical protein Aple_000710 [Acrocarpospora pleiomorpha]
MSTDTPGTYPSDPGDELIFANDRIRVWAMNLGPGEAIFFHQHQHDHLILWPQAGRAVAHDVDEEDWIHVQNAETNFAFFKTVGRGNSLKPHRLKNLEDHPMTHYIIELVSEESPSEVELPAESNGRGYLSRPHVIVTPEDHMRH